MEKMFGRKVNYFASESSDLSIAGYFVCDILMANKEGQIVTHFIIEQGNGDGYPIFQIIPVEHLISFVEPLGIEDKIERAK